MAVNSRVLLIWPLLAVSSGSPALASSGRESSQAGIETKTVVERFRFDAGAELAAPAGVAAEDGTLCVGTVDGYVHSLSADGHYRWSYSLHGSITARPLHVGKRWFVATNAERLYAFNDDGSLAWVFKLPSAATSELAADFAGSLYFVASDRFFYGISGRGAIIARANFGQLSAGPELGRDGAVWAENGAGVVLRARAREIIRFGAGARPEFEFSDPELMRDPDGHEWRGSSDGRVAFRVAADQRAMAWPVTRSALLNPIWSKFAGYAVFSARSGLVIALAPVSVGSGH